METFHLAAPFNRDFHLFLTLRPHGGLKSIPLPLEAITLTIYIHVHMQRGVCDLQ